MKFLITGGAGFIGSQLIRYLIQFTKNKVKQLQNKKYYNNSKKYKNDVK